ncbi:isochorismatase family protein [Streptomyces sp. NPDC051315]|uniref:isochorismatase family protein n=1 Tax=Streptomyces sp. NPDC051315 TaxID=3365650 RepID=UPI00379EF0B1
MTLLAASDTRPQAHVPRRRRRTEETVRARGVEEVDGVGTATDHGVRATAPEAVKAGVRVRVLMDDLVGVALRTTAAALDGFQQVGVAVSGAAPAQQNPPSTGLGLCRSLVGQRRREVAAAGPRTRPAVVWTSVSCADGWLTEPTHTSCPAAARALAYGAWQVSRSAGCFPQGDDVAGLGCARPSLLHEGGCLRCPQPATGP